jgi:hypothetical protein
VDTSFQAPLSVIVSTNQSKGVTRPHPAASALPALAKPRGAACQKIKLPPFRLWNQSGRYRVIRGVEDVLWD